MIICDVKFLKYQNKSGNNTNNDSNNCYFNQCNHYNKNDIYINNNTLYVLVRLVRYAGMDRTMLRTTGKRKEKKEKCDN